MDLRGGDRVVASEGAALRGLAAIAAIATIGGAASDAAAEEALPVAPGGPAPVTASGDGGAVYAPAFFAPYNPVTAADMVTRVPGFELRDGDERRGFGGTAGNLLINGERPSSKTVPSELLKRIPAANVVQVEVLSGTSAAADVRGQSQLVNVVLKETAGDGAETTYVLGLRHIQYANRVGWTAQASRTMRLSPTAMLAVDLQAPNTLGRGEMFETLFAGDGAITGTRFQVGKANNKTLQGSAHLGWRPTDVDTININLLYAPNWNGSKSAQLEADRIGLLRSALDGLTDYSNNYKVEVGADWEHRFADTLTVKLIGLFSNTSVDQFDRFDIFNAPATRLVRTQERSTLSGERIGRVQVKWTVSEAHTLEFGGEGAFNFRDTSLDIVNQFAGQPPAPVPLAVSDARVEEVRGEVFATDIWTVTPKLSVEAGARFETSRITQSGDQAKERQFSYLKPQFSATYVHDAANTFRASLIRDVAQLDFAEFSSAVDFLNTSTIQGNPDLVPEKAWKSRIEWEHRFGGRAAMTLAAFYDKVEDVHDLVVINGLDAYGNIGDGTRVGAEVSATLPLAPIGVPNAELRVSGIWQETKVTDPITGEERSFSVPVERQGTASGSATLNGGNKDWAYLVTYRHNLPAWSSSFGASLFQWAGRAEYRRAETIEYVRPKPRLDLYVETTAIAPVTIRLYLNNVTVSSEERTRTFYVGDRSTGQIQRLEWRRNVGGPEGSRTAGFTVSGRF